jgi:putative OPT family oligopeptide transporter
LILGFSIEGSELAAILGFGILRGILRRSSIVENNINQTLASSVNGASAGMMFSVPALFILGQKEGFIGISTEFSAVLMVFSCIAGGILGIAFIIPLRKQMIDYERLTYPGGVAVATILKSPGAGVHKAILLIVGMAASGIVHFVCQATGFEDWNMGKFFGMPEYMNSIWYISLMTIGVGFIAGRGGFCFIIGGFVCYWILSPLLAAKGLLPSPDTLAALKTDMPDYLSVTLFRPVGIGMLVGGALTQLSQLRRGIAIFLIFSPRSVSKSP